MQVPTLLVVFVLGICIGSFLNVCVYRLPRFKSVIWPSSHCGVCFQRIRWQDNVPLLGYLLLRGRCRSCGTGFSCRYFFVELGTGLAFVGLYYLEVVANVHRYDVNLLGEERFQAACWITFIVHALLVSILIAATLTDIDHKVIPLQLTVVGTAIGLGTGMLFPWPWPYQVDELAIVRWQVDAIPVGLQPWPVWGPLPAWCQPGGNVATGLATALAGILFGQWMLRLVRITFGIGMGPDYNEDPDPEWLKRPHNLIERFVDWLARVGGKTLGLGDADLMMMAGAFFGWQVVLLSFFVGVIVGAFVGVAQLIRFRFRSGEPHVPKDELDAPNILPFGPSLAIGILITFLNWNPIGKHFQLVLFDGPILIFLAVVAGVSMIVAGYVLRLRNTLTG